jgi:hypothetical protein
MTMTVVFLISYPHFSCHRADAVGPRYGDEADGGNGTGPAVAVWARLAFAKKKEAAGLTRRRLFPWRQRSG